MNTKASPTYSKNMDTRCTSTRLFRSEKEHSGLYIPHIIQLRESTYILKFELMKLYSVDAAVRCLLRNKKIKTDYTLIDSSSGVYAYSLAMVCHKFGLKCHIVGSSVIDSALKYQIEALGASIELVKPNKGLPLDQEERMERIQVLQENKKTYWMRQYHDDIHYLGYQQVAKMIIDKVGTDNLVLIGGVGSGASTGGIIKYLREKDPTVELCGIQPYGSMSFGGQQIKDPDMLINGIGSSIHFKNIRHDFYDYIHWISFNYARGSCVELFKNHGIFSGLSTGCGYLLSEWLRKTEGKQKYLFIGADTGHKYMNSVYMNNEAIGTKFMDFHPVKIESNNDVKLPWCYMAWNRRNFADTGGKT